MPAVSEPGFLSISVPLSRGSHTPALFWCVPGGSIDGSPKDVSVLTPGMYVLFQGKGKLRFLISYVLEQGDHPRLCMWALCGYQGL